MDLTLESLQYYLSETAQTIKELCTDMVKSAGSLNRTSTRTAMKINDICNKKTPVILTIIDNEDYLNNLTLYLKNYNIVNYVYQGSKTPSRNNKIIKSYSDITPDILPDVVICQNIRYNYLVCRDIADRYGCPLIIVEHNQPTKDTKSFYQEIRYNRAVFYSEEHYSLWNCENPVIIKPTYTDIHKNNINNNKVILIEDSSLSSVNNNINLMYQGNCLIAPAVYENNKIIKNDSTGYLYSKIDPMIKNLCQSLEKNTEFVEEISINAKDFIVKNYNKYEFIKKWQDLILENL